MKNQTTKSTHKGKRLLILGFIGIAFIFLIYARFQDSESVTPAVLDPLQRISYAFYIILLMSFIAITFGMKMYQKQKAEENDKGLLSIIAISTWNTKSRKIFLITFVLYGLFFSLTSGMLIYQPDVTFSIHYGAEIPSGFISPCCGPPGYMPKIIVYLTEHIGLNIIPLNLVLQFTVSYLVALNMALAVGAISISKKAGGLGSTGATTGLFIACPTCAGTFLSLFFGTASGIGLSVILSQLQTLFIAISIPILLVTPFILAKKLRKPDGSCAINL